MHYGLFQRKGETCAEFGSDWFRNVNLYNCNSLVSSFLPDEVPNCRHMDAVHVSVYHTHFQECITLGLGTSKFPQGRDFL
jgi:hypothetical protein